jgi:hypothetical protein
MKKLLIAATVSLVCVGAFAQGKLSFDINSDNLIYLTTDAAHILPADLASTSDNGFGAGALPLAGSALYTGLGLNNTPGTVASLAGSPTFTVALFGGASAGSLTLQTTTTIADVSNPGGIAQVNVTFASLPSGTPAFFQEVVYDSRSASVAAALAAGQYAGQGVVFQATPQPSSYSPIYLTAAEGAGVNSTLAAGTFVPTDLAQLGGGYFGGIAVFANPTLTPEPGTFALAGLGLAALLVLRRRNS